MLVFVGKKEKEGKESKEEDRKEENDNGTSNTHDDMVPHPTQVQNLLVTSFSHIQVL